ncbi:RibD family protein [Puia sp. P3]|uniref:RibD family protein n=1 Tax=Puia sp. P3 TaxID=3423952 RepID=UPI003D66F85E
MEVTVGILEEECVELNRRFFTFNTKHRPYIVLKWAQSGDGRIAGPGEGRVLISNEYTNRLVHRWRSEEAAILVGTRTALMDDPALTARLWKGPDPVRLVVDKELSLPASLKLFDGKVRTIVFNSSRHEEGDMLSYYQLAGDSSLVHQLMIALHRLKIQSVLVEGGARLLQSFIDEGYWDEARVITNTQLELPGGLSAPVLGTIQPISHESLFTDTIRYYRNI